MDETLGFPDLLRLIDERSTAFRAAVAVAPSLDVQVPTCPDWTLFDLVRHLGDGRRAWAATIAAGPHATAKAAPRGDSAVPREREALLDWSAESARQLLDALREAGPDRGCWTWWGKSQSPQTCAAVARRQLHEIAVHTYDAQLTVGAPQPLPEEVALDGAEEFLSTARSTTADRPGAFLTKRGHRLVASAVRVTASVATAGRAAQRGHAGRDQACRLSRRVGPHRRGNARDNGA